MAQLTNIAGLARRLNLSQQWLRRETAAGRIPFLQAGHKRLFNPEAVEIVLAERARKAVAQ